MYSPETYERELDATVEAGRGGEGQNVVRLAGRIEGPEESSIECHGDPYRPIGFIFPLFERGDLLHLIHEDRHLGYRPKAAWMTQPLATRLRYALQVARGLAWLHSKVEGPKAVVLHLDLGSHNVLVDGSGRACISDYGLSRVRRRRAPAPDDDDTDGPLSYSQAFGGRDVPGAAAWRAPESWEHTEAAPLGPWTDVYALGCIIYECATGCLPFHKPDGTSDDVIGGESYRTLVKRRTRPTYWPADVPAGVKQIVAECWAAEATARPTARDVRKRLKAEIASLLGGSASARDGGEPSSLTEAV